MYQEVPYNYIIAHSQLSHWILQSLQVPLVLEPGAAMGCKDTMYLRFEERQ